MQYQMPDACLETPSAKIQDLSMNILKFPELGASLIITRGALEADKTLAQSFDGQVRKLQQQGGFKSQGRQEVRIGPAGDIPAIEIQHQLARGKETVHQFQLACACPDGERMLALSYVKDSPLTEADRQHWQAIKASVQFPPSTTGA